MVAVAALATGASAYPNRTLPFESFRAPVVESMYTRSPTAIAPPAAATSSSYTPLVFTVIRETPSASVHGSVSATAGKEPISTASPEPGDAGESTADTGTSNCTPSLYTWLVAIG